MTDTPPPPPDTPPPLIMGRSGLVELNIGGKPYTTTRQTLENSGFLRALTSGSFAAPRDAQGRIFVDRDATPAFDTMLTFLRGALGRTALDRMDLTTRAELVAEAEFYDVPALIEGADLRLDEIFLVAVRLRTFNTAPDYNFSLLIQSC